LTVNPSATNRRYWDAMAAVHGQDAHYDTEALAAGASSLGELEEAAVREAVGDVAGLDVIHIQCHIAYDAISLARRGARVAGADLSPAALAKARATAERCGVALELVEAPSSPPTPRSSSGTRWARSSRRRSGRGCGSRRCTSTSRSTATRAATCSRPRPTAAAGCA
jgi:hypothetical protein